MLPSSMIPENCCLIARTPQIAETKRLVLLKTLVNQKIADFADFQRYNFTTFTCTGTVPAHAPSGP